MVPPRWGKLSLQGSTVSASHSAIMKFSLICLATGVAALPAAASSQGASIERRQGSTAVVDELMFSITLPQFTARRDALDPPDLIWESDGCTSSPDNPFGFPFVPACNRHDFGYHNFRAQTRFTESNKLKIDDNFKDDLYFQCESSSVSGVCRGLADVYYAAVRAFGGDDATPGRRNADEDWVAIYEEKVEIYNQLVKEAQDNGELPVLA